MAVVEQGRILVTLAVQIKEQPAANNQLARDQLLFWSTADGKLLSEIDLGLHWRLRDCPRDGLSCSNNSRWVAFHFDPIDFHREAPSKPFWLFRFLFPNQPSKDAAQILLIDAMERREIAFLPGRSATFSPNGRWLATIDADGIVRVWELPLRRPWFRIFGFAAIATLACALAFGIIRWSFRRVSSA
jgi:WD40 repeat protein